MAMRTYRVKTNLREALKRADITQRALAAAIDMDVSNISNIVNGKQRDLQVSSALKIADALGSTVEELFELVEEPATEGAAA